MAAEIQLRLYEELNDSLPSDKKKHRFAYQLGSIRTVKELLSSLTVPEKDVELVLVNGILVDLSCVLHEGDFVSIYPVFESLDVTPLIRIRERPLRQTRFITGAGLLRLADYLRRLGFNTFIPHCWTFEKIFRVAEKDRRILLTRDPSLLKSPEISRIYLVQAAEPRDQLREVLSRFDLFDRLHFSGLQPMLARILKPQANSK